MDSNIDEVGTILIGQTSPVSYFDEVIGHIEDIILSSEFQDLQDSFFEKHWQSIDNTEENKHEYMGIFEEYTQTFENFFIVELSRRMQSFDMKNFAYLLDKNEAFHDTANYSEVFELLHSFSDFQVFKELILDYRKKKEGDFKHLEFDILITTPLIYKNATGDNCCDDNNEVAAAEANILSTDSNCLYNEANATTSPNVIDVTEQFINSNQI